MLAPPWITVPPPGYGGIEAVVALLCDALVNRGHQVTLFAAPGTTSTATVHPLLESSFPHDIGSALHESDHVAAAYDAIDAAATTDKPFDIVHDHSGFIAVAIANRLSTPVVHTMHGPFTENTSRFYARHGHKVSTVAISRSQLKHAPPGLQPLGVVPNPIAVDDWPLCTEKDDYLLWIGRMHPTKGAHRAIAAARRAGRRLVLAGPVQTGQEEYFHTQIEPHLDGDLTNYVGEVGGEIRKQLFARAAGLLMPIRWVEPFGMVMIEALACGTPVIAFNEGAAKEIVIHGENGLLVSDSEEMAQATSRLHTIDPLTCRLTVASRYDVDTVVAGYEAIYQCALAASAGLTTDTIDASPGLNRSLGPTSHRFREQQRVIAAAQPR